MSETNVPVVLFQNNKFFWRTRNSIDVTIVQYKELNVTEIISYEPSLDKEAPRIYLNSTVLATKLDYEEIAAKVGAAKRNVPQFTTDVMNQAISDYILNRLFVSELTRDPKKFAVKIQFNFRDRELEASGGSMDQIICEKPASLKPYNVVHHRILTSEEVSSAFKALEDAQRTLREECNKALEIQAETSALEELSMKERWRIPIVVARIAKNRRLSDADNRIWAAVSRNMTTQEAIEKLTQATLRPPVSRPVVMETKANTPVISSSPTPSTVIGRVFRSTRLFAPTVSSQNRVNAEETKTKAKPFRKLFDRGQPPHHVSVPAHTQARVTIPNSVHKTSTHSSTARTAGTSTHSTIHSNNFATVKVPRKSHRRKHKHRRKSQSEEEQKGEGIDPDEEEENEASLVDHISAGFVNFASTLSSKFNRSAKVHSTSADDAESITQTSFTVDGQRPVGGSTTFRETDEVVEFVEDKESQPSHHVAQKITVGAVGGFEDDPSESKIGTSSPTKSRAFFGPFLASLSRKNTNSHPFNTLSGKESPVVSGSHHSTGQQSSPNSPKPSPMRSLGSLGNFFGGTLSRLMPWSTPPNQVIPSQ